MRTPLKKTNYDLMAIDTVRMWLVAIMGLFREKCLIATTIEPDIVEVPQYRLSRS